MRPLSDEEARLARALATEASDDEVARAFADASPELPEPSPDLEKRVMAGGRRWLDERDRAPSKRANGTGKLRWSRLKDLLRPAPVGLAAAAMGIGLVIGASLPSEPATTSYGYGGSTAPKDEGATSFEDLLERVERLTQDGRLSDARDLIVQARPKMQDGLHVARLTLRLAALELKLGEVERAQRILDEEEIVLEIRRLEEALRNEAPRTP